MSDPVVPGRRARRARVREGAPSEDASGGGGRTGRLPSRQQLRPRGQLLVALVLVAIVVAGGILAEEALGERAPGAGSPGTVASGAWYCPHGGGDGWEATIAVANPGSEPVEVRARRLGPERAPGNERVSVAPGSSVELSAEAGDRGSATVLEYFGGHVAAGWVARTGNEEVGVAAEPCLPEAGESWTLGDGTAGDEDQETFVVVMNPFAGDAVFTLEVLRASGPPGNLSAWDDFVLPAGRSTSFRLDEFAEGDEVLGARITSSLGRVAAATLGITKDRGVRSAIGVSGEPPDQAYLPGAGDDGGSAVTIVAPGDRSTTYAGSVFGGRGSQLIDKGREQRQRGETSARVAVETTGPSTIWLRGGRGRPGFVATRRAAGVEQDLGATTGVPAAAPDWIVFPSVGEAPQEPTLVLTNPGAEPARLTLTTLPTEGNPVVKQLEIRPGRTVEAPKGLLKSSPRAPVLVHASSGSVLAATASYSQGKDGHAAYAVSAGVAIDAGWVADTP